MGLIVKHLAAYAINIVKNSASAKAMWTDLKASYENRTAANQIHLLNHLLRLRMKDDDKVENHFARLDNLIAELQLSGVELGDQQLLSAILLLSMPSSYGPAVTALTISAKEDLVYESVKMKLKNHNLQLLLESTGNLESSTTLEVVFSSTVERRKRSPCCVGHFS